MSDPAATRRFKTEYPGVFYREAVRIGGSGLERVYYIVFKKDGKFHEEKAGRQYADNMTPARAARMRSDRIEGRRKSRKEIRRDQDQIRLNVAHRWTFDRIWDEYRSVKTIKGLVADENRYRNHLFQRFGNMEPGELTPSDIDQFRAQLLRKYEAGTVGNVLELLRRLVNFAGKRNLCAIPNFKFELPRNNNQKTEDLTPEQLAILLEVLEKDHNRTAANMMKLALLTGMRRSEMFRLKWSDIDHNRGFILIRGPKGGQDQRIPLNNAAIGVLENQPKSGEYVFPGRGGKQRVDINKEVNRIKKAAGLPKSFRSLHGLRHVFASMLASSGQVDMYTLQKLLTHKSPAMTQRYAHLRDEALRKASNVAADMIENSSVKKV